GPFPKRTSGFGLDDDALRSEEGIAEAQEREKESQRLLYVGFTRARDRAILAHRPNKTAWLDLIPDAKRILDPGLTAGEHPLKACKTTFAIRQLGPLEMEDLIPTPEKESWLVRADRPERTNASSPRYASPSAEPPRPEARKILLENLPGDHPFSGSMKYKD